MLQWFLNGVSRARPDILFRGGASKLTEDCGTTQQAAKWQTLQHQSDDAGGSKAEPTLQIGRYQSPVADSELQNFFSNLRDFLFERPVNTKGMKPTVFNTPGFGESLRDNLNEFLRSAPRGPVNSDLLVNWNAGFGGFWQNLRDIDFAAETGTAEDDQPARGCAGNLVEEHAIYARASAVSGRSRD